MVQRLENSVNVVVQLFMCKSPKKLDSFKLIQKDTDHLSCHRARHEVQSGQVANPPQG